VTKPIIDTVVEANRALLLQRSQVGIGKYGVTLGNAGLSHRQLLQHMLEEALDFANYAQTIIQQLDAEAAPAADDRVKDGVQGTHGGTLVRGDDHIEVKAERDGRTLASVRVEGLDPGQLRLVHQLAELWAAVGSQPEYFDGNVARVADLYRPKGDA